MNAKTVAVTGGAGRLGQEVVRRLIDEGWSPVILDRVRPATNLCPFVTVDFTDFGQAVDALNAVDSRHGGVDAIVHLASIPGPGWVPNNALFMNNLSVTYNIFSAARLLGIRNIVWASSESVYGPDLNDLPDLPVVEASPLRPQNTYGLVKKLEETIAEQFCQQDPDMKIVGLRLSWIMHQHDYARFGDFARDPSIMRPNLWSYVDVQDASQALILALDYRTTGFDVFLIASRDSVMPIPTGELVAAELPRARFHRPIEGHRSLLASDKAQELLGYRPHHRWRDGEG